MASDDRILPDSWRSPFWNTVTSILLFGMSLMLLISAFADSILFAVAFGVMCAILLAASVRALFLGVRARPDGIVSRELTRTRIISWSQVAAIEDAAQVTSAAGWVGSQVPVVVLHPAGDKEAKRIELPALGGYGWWPFGNRVRRTADELTAHLEAYRRRSEGEP